MYLFGHEVVTKLCGFRFAYLGTHARHPTLYVWYEHAIGRHDIANTRAIQPAALA
jgi:hypothetical protein